MSETNQASAVLLGAARDKDDVMTADDLAGEFISAFADPQALALLLAEDATWTYPPSAGIRPLVGRDAITTFMDHLYTDVLDGDAVQVDVLDTMVGDGLIALRFHLEARTKDGRLYDNEHATFLTVEDGQISSVADHLDVAHGHHLLSPPNSAAETGLVERSAADRVKVSTSIEIEAPHGVVWQVLTDFDAMPSWSSSFQGLELDGPFQQGTPMVAKYRAMGMEQRYQHSVEFFEAGAQFGWSDPVSMGIVDHHIFRVEALPNGRTRLLQTDEFRGHAVRLLGGALARQAVTTYQSFNRELKAEAEAVQQLD